MSFDKPKIGKVFATSALRAMGLPDDVTGEPDDATVLVREIEWGLQQHRRLVFREPGQPDGEAWEIVWKDNIGPDGPLLWQGKHTIHATLVHPASLAKIEAFKAIGDFARALGDAGPSKAKLAHMQHEIARMSPPVDAYELGPAIDMPKGCECDPALREEDRCDGQMMRCVGAIRAWRETREGTPSAP